LSPWTAAIPIVRRVSADTLFPALDFLGTQRHDFPQSRPLLAAAKSALAEEEFGDRPRLNT
jgi:hypothetical protein